MKTYAVVDQDGTEVLCYSGKPSLIENEKGTLFWRVPGDGKYVYLEKGSIEKLIGRELTYKDEPVVVYDDGSAIDY